MRKFIFRSALSAALVLVGLNFSSCSNDSSDEPTPSGPVTVNPANVFVNGLPKQVGNMQITTNSDGLVSKITNGYTTATFSYPCMSRAAAPDVIININQDDYSYVANLYLNESGYVRYLEYVDEEGIIKMWMEYNDDDQLSRLKGTSSEGSETMTFTYDNGAVARITGNYGQKLTIEYGTAPMENKGGLLTWDYMIMDEDEFLGLIYYAGMLGKATKLLPVKSIWNEPEYTETTNFSWTLNNSGFPTKLKFTSISSDGDSYTDERIFVW